MAKKYVSLERLTEYDAKIKTLIGESDDSVLASAKSYADGLASNYDASGSAATAKSEAISEAGSYTDAQVKALADGQVKTNKDAIAAIKDHATVDSFGDVVAELAKKQDAGDYATKSEAQGYANAKDGAISAAQAAADAAQADATANAQAIAAINDGTNGILAQAKGFTTQEVGKVQGAVDTLAGKVGTVPEGSTVMGIITNIQENAYDDTEIREDIDAVSGKVTTLIGEDSGKSVRTIAAEELAEQLVADNADVALDTLEEIAAWIQSHPEDAAAMNAAITALQNQLKDIPAGEGTVKKYVDDAISALKIGDYAKASDLTALATKVAGLETASATLATKTEVQAVSTALNEYKDAHVNDYSNDTIDAKIKVNADAIAKLGDTYATDDELAQAIAGEVSRADGAYAAKSLETTVSTHAANTVMHTTADEKSLWNAALQASDIVTGTVNGTVKVKGTDVAVKGLGSAAFTEASAYDVAGAAAGVQTKLDEEVARAKAAEKANADAIALFVEVTADEIEALFA